MNFLKKIFNHINRDKDIILDCYTYLPYVYETAKINYAYKYIPDWWKNTPKFTTETNEASIKNCLGIKEYYKTGIVIPAWFGLQLKIYPLNHPEGITYSYKSSTEHFKDISHSTSQFPLFAGKNKINFKIESPWLIKCNELINFTWTHPLYNLSHATDKNFDLMPAVINFRHQYDSNINYIITQENDVEKTIEIEPLSPLVIMHPMSNKRISFRYHLVTKEEWNHHNNLHYYIFRNTAEEVASGYQNKKKLQKKIENINCPYSGDTKCH